MLKREFRAISALIFIGILQDTLSDLLNIKSLYLVYLLIFSQINHLKLLLLSSNGYQFPLVKKKKKNTLLHFHTEMHFFTV